MGVFAMGVDQMGLGLGSYVIGARVGMAMTSFCLVWLPGRSLCVAGAGWEYWGCGMQEPVGLVAIC